MKQYPTISRDILNGSYYAFNKIDGSNIRAEWNRKRGFYKFGSRKRLLGTDQGVLAEAEDLVKSKYEGPITDRFKKKRLERVICFFEFFGPNSFAGFHQEECHDVLLFDINVHRKGILGPRDFLDLTEGVEIAPLLYRGNINDIFIQMVRDGTLEGISAEGVVCKGAPLKKGYPPHMFKIKTDAWMQRLKEHCGDDQKMFEALK